MEEGGRTRTPTPTALSPTGTVTATAAVTTTASLRPSPTKTALRWTSATTSLRPTQTATVESHELPHRGHALEAIDVLPVASVTVLILVCGLVALLYHRLPCGPKRRASSDYSGFTIEQIEALQDLEVLPSPHQTISRPSSPGADGSAAGSPTSVADDFPVIITVDEEERQERGVAVPSRSGLLALPQWRTGCDVTPRRLPGGLRRFDRTQCREASPPMPPEHHHQPVPSPPQPPPRPAPTPPSPPLQAAAPPQPIDPASAPPQKPPEVSESPPRTPSRSPRTLSGSKWKLMSIELPDSSPPPTQPRTPPDARRVDTTPSTLPGDSVLYKDPGVLKCSICTAGGQAVQAAVVHCTRCLHSMCRLCCSAAGRCDHRLLLILAKCNACGAAPAQWECVPCGNTCCIQCWCAGHQGHPRKEMYGDSADVVHKLLTGQSECLPPNLAKMLVAARPSGTSSPPTSPAVPPPFRPPEALHHPPLRRHQGGLCRMQALLPLMRGTRRRVLYPIPDELFQSFLSPEDIELSSTASRGTSSSDLSRSTNTVSSASNAVPLQ
eukprot:Sspe_Gene.72658::Locus_43470_Transcript_1_2_Confidence_0.571_Length_1756::g.72658::m.72658